MNPKNPFALFDDICTIFKGQWFERLKISLQYLPFKSQATQLKKADG